MIFFVCIKQSCAEGEFLGNGHEKKMCILMLVLLIINYVRILIGDRSDTYNNM